MASSIYVTTDLQGLSADLESFQLGLGREVTKMKRDAAEIVASQARRNAPVLTGGLRDSISGQARGVVSNVPQGPVWEFGGTIRPRGYPINIPRSEMATRAGQTEVGRVEDMMAREAERLLARLF